jgi:hypothetical protein
MSSGSYNSALRREMSGRGATVQTVETTHDDIPSLEQTFGLWGKLQARLNPFAPRQGETLPTGTFQNAQGRVIREAVRVPDEAINFDALIHEVEYNRQHLLITCFVNGLHDDKSRSAWMLALQSAALPGRVITQWDAGGGFVYVKTDSVATTQRLLLQTPHSYGDGTAVYQEWVPTFCPSRPVGIYLPTWISLKFLPVEYWEMAHVVAGVVGKVLCSDPQSLVRGTPRFCVGLSLEDGWVASIHILGLFRVMAEVLVDYDTQHIRCRSCLSLFHATIDCPQFNLKSSKDTSSSPLPTQGPKHQVPPRTTGPSISAPTYRAQPQAHYRRHPHRIPHPRPPSVDGDGYTRVQHHRQTSRTPGEAQWRSSQARRPRGGRNRHW